MNSSWLLVFKEDIISQPAQVQKALFEHLVLLVLDEPGLASLEASAARQVVRSVFIHSVHSRFPRLNGEEIANRLKFRTSVFIQQHGRKKVASSEEKLHCDAAALLLGWNEIADYLDKLRRKRRSLRMWGTIAALVVMFLVGGFVFVMAAPVQEAYSLPEPAQEQRQPLEER
ncbi:hypothetical protein [Paenibacillus rigui]|uniref:Uncharacterized protein n=1 Tax=Paenibacillus rigui TaxID=554312 RepID=A0A229UM73_9BACL|nr:hypothetical protein [Paenibacillus rigui]OXM84414.1 hypothetical protein CF651_20575 [Paenibacillus rigui]